MTDRVTVGNLRVAQVLYDFINNEAKGTNVAGAHSMEEFAGMLKKSVGFAAF